MDQKQAGSGIRLWPGVVIVVVQWLAVFGTGIVAPASMLQFFGMMGGTVGGLLLLLIWWAFASRAPRFDRVLGAVLLVLGLVPAFALAHVSTPMALFSYGIPVLCLAFVAWAFVTRQWADRPRRVSMVAVILLACGFWLLVRTDGVDGDLGTQFAWRWQSTAEERLLASEAGKTRVATSLAEGDAPNAFGLLPSWPGFRGPGRDGVVTGVRILTDWEASPPQELWRRPVGPGWGSFAVAGDRLFTQEQRGDEEIVACYQASSGEPIWLHSDSARFWEAMAGAGPRGTPTLHGGRVYTLGATGILNALDAGDGSSIWSRDMVKDTGATVPDWGFASSPLVVDDRVVVYTGAQDGKAVVAYDLANGEPRWFAPAGQRSYSSAHLATLDGVRQLVLLSDHGASGIAPDDGEVLWSHEWPVKGGARVVQPAILEGRDVLIGTGFGMGLRRIEVSQSASGPWQIEEGWTTSDLDPYYNDFVVHEGHAYGFDGRILAGVNLDTGERAWKGGRYGNGQLVLLPEQDLLLVLSDRGDVALVGAEPGGFTEIARMPAIEGKTWNHPVIADGVLYVRNSEEMAAFRLSLIEPQQLASDFK